MYSLLAVFCVSRLLGVGSCGSRHSVGPRSGAGRIFWAIAFCFLLFAFSKMLFSNSNLSGNQNREEYNPWGSWELGVDMVWIFGQSEE